MAETVTLARPYAQALFRLAKDSQTLPAWGERLQRLAAIAQNPEMERIVGNPKFSPTQVAELVVSIAGEGSHAEVVAFVELLAANERLEVLPEILALYTEMQSADAGVKEALVTSAFSLDDAQLHELVRELEAHFGSKLQPRVEVDPTLIGGVRVAVGDQVLDASVRGKLEAMATALKN